MSGKIRSKLLVETLMLAVLVFALLSPVLHADPGNPTPPAPIPGKAGGEPLRILVSNDDGVNSEGILALVRELRKIAEVTVVAPKENFSGAGHMLTIDGPIMVNEVKREGQFFGFGAKCSPASCVKLGLDNFCEKRPDLVVTGINEGHNLGRTIFVSGTFNAAQEGVFKGVPGIAFSLERDKNKMDYDTAAEFARILVEKFVHFGIPQDTVINVNIPSCPRNEIKGIALATLSDFQYKEIWVRRKNPWGQVYFWQSIRKPVRPPEVGSDEWAVGENMIAVTPVPIAFDNKPAFSFMSRFQLSFDGKGLSNYLKK